LEGDVSIETKEEEEEEEEERNKPKKKKKKNLGFVVPCIFKYSIKQPTRCTINLKFIVLSRIHHSTCFGHCCSHHQEPPPTAFAASGYRMIASGTSNPAIIR
jgi:hypothetical protein